MSDFLSTDLAGSFERANISFRNYLEQTQILHEHFTSNHYQTAATERVPANLMGEPIREERKPRKVQSEFSSDVEWISDEY